FGDPAIKADFDAYLVGSAFLFFLDDAHGAGTSKRVLVDIGKTRSLARSLASVLGQSQSEVEQAWEGYLRAARREAKPPAIALMVPDNGATGVAPDLAEVFVTFDADMAPNICLGTTCTDGLCYDHATWKDARTLAIRAAPALQPNHVYVISLGV